jgi:Fic family protein
MKSVFKYEISHQLLANIRDIYKLVVELNYKRIPNNVYSELSEKAVEHSLKAFKQNSFSEKEDVNYKKALEKFGKKKNYPFNIDLILSVHYEITQGLLPEKQVGRCKNKEMKNVVKDLVKDVNDARDVVDPVILAGFFYQNFLSIKPFVHGNEKTAFLAMRILLSEMKVNVFKLFNFEKVESKNIEAFSGGILQEMMRVKNLLEKSTSLPSFSLKEYHEKIINFIRKHGFITDSDYSLLTERKKATRVLDFNKLIGMGLIERKGKGKQTHYVLKA